MTLQDQLAKLWDPRRRPTPLEWAQENVILDKRFSPRPGKFDCDYTPYMRRLHEWFADPKIRQLTFVKAAQVAGTTWLANCMMWVVAEDPGPMLYVTSTGDNAKSWSERELMPRVRASHALRPFMPADDDDFRKQEMHFTSCTLRLTGSNSEGNLASRPIRYLFADEVDKWPDQSSTEAPALELAKARTNFYRSICKICLVSTPTVETGAIWTEYLNGSQHKYFCPCPDCGHHQELIFPQIKWPKHHRDLAGDWDLDAVAKDAVYQCEKCESPWSQNHKPTIISRGDWAETNPKAPSDHLSCHISSLYSPVIPWGDLAKLFLQKCKTPGGLHDFRNNFLGLPFENLAAKVKDESVTALTRPPIEYTLGRLPIEPVLITLCADPGAAATHWSVEALDGQGDSWVIEYGAVLQVEDLLASDFLSRREYTFGEKKFRPRFGLIDSGWGLSTARVYEVCKHSRGLFQPSKGSAASFGTWGHSAIQGYPQLRLITYADFTTKFQLYIERIEKKQPPHLWFPVDTGKDFLDAHCGQRVIEKPNDRHTPRYFKNVEGDHWGDCTKLHQVARWCMRGGV